MTSRTVERRVLLATILGSALAFLDGTIVAVVLPTIQRDFDAGVAAAQWVFEAYALFLAALLLVGGALGDHYGRRRVFRIGVAVFTLASAACGFAPSANTLIAARAVQGVGAALLVPGSLALITAVFPTQRRGAAFGTWSAMSALTAAMGPALGGVIADLLGWRGVFFINIPVGFAVIALLAGVPESRDEKATRLDVPGAALATVGLGGITFGLVEANRFGAPGPLIWGSAALGVIALVAFVWWETRTTHPMLPMSLFKDKTFSGLNAVTLLLYGALSGAFFFVPFQFIEYEGYSRTLTGLAMLPFIGAITVLSRPAGRFGDRVGVRVPVAAGCLVVAIGYTALAFAGGHPYWVSYLPAFLLAGSGMALVVAPLTTGVMAAAPAERVGIASGVNNAVSRAAGLLAVAVFGLIAVALFTAALPSDVATALGSDTAKLAAAAPAAGEPDPDGVRAAVLAAFLSAFRNLMLLAAAGALFAAVLAWFTVPARQAPAPEAPATPPGDGEAAPVAPEA